MDANEGRLLRFIVTSDDEDKSWAYRDEPVGCGFSPDGTQLISISRKGEFKLWDSATGSRLSAFGGSDSSSLEKEVCTFSSDGSHVLWREQVWDVATGQKLPALLDHGYWYVPMMKRDGEKLVARGNKGPPVRVTVSRYSPDGKWIATGAEDGTLKLWDAPTLTERRSITAHPFAITACAFAPDRLRLATGSADNTVRIWDLNAEDNGSATREAHEPNNDVRVLARRRTAGVRVD
jgi:WD40 repeat protein